MKKLVSCTTLALLLATGSAFAADTAAQPDKMATPAEQMAPARATDMMATLPGGALPISDYYNQAVYDNRDNKVGDVNDLLLDNGGKINAVIVGVGGFLGVGEKNVAVPFSSLKVAEKNGSRYLVLETTKEVLQTAPGYVYDSGKKVWLPATKQG
ncbi:MAG TPA: PRC-barrel domain-containing protein [Methyloceanibacter sp.]|nr:PRC-barrel domain-containing protein [Methyloceanibacter sp.]